jgi:hypothetical protein
MARIYLLAPRPRFNIAPARGKAAHSSEPGTLGYTGA